MKIIIMSIILCFIGLECGLGNVTDSSLQNQDVISLQKYVDYPRLFAHFYFDITFDERLNTSESRYLNSVLESPNVIFAKYYKLSNIGLIPQKSIKYLHNKDTVMNFIAEQKINLPKTDCTNYSFSKTRQWIGQFSNTKEHYENVLKVSRIHIDSTASSYVSEVYINLGDVKNKYQYAENMDKNGISDIYQIFSKRRDGSFYCGCMDSVIAKKKFKYLKKEEFIAEEDRTEWRN